MHADPLTGDNEVEEEERQLVAAGGGMAAPPPRPERARTSRAVDPRDPETWGRVSRNAPCPCGSGRKYKHCHGKA